MSAETKRKEVLQMLSKGAISAAEASELLNQIQSDLQPETPAVEPEQSPDLEPSVEPDRAPPPGKRARWLNIKVTDTMSERHKVSVRLPLALARLGIRIGARFAPEVDEVDWNEILEEISAGELGTLVEVQDESDHELIQVFVS